MKVTQAWAEKNAIRCKQLPQPLGLSFPFSRCIHGSNLFCIFILHCNKLKIELKPKRWRVKWKTEKWPICWDLFGNAWHSVRLCICHCNRWETIMKIYFSHSHIHCFLQFLFFVVICFILFNEMWHSVLEVVPCGLRMDIYKLCLIINGNFVCTIYFIGIVLKWQKKWKMRTILKRLPLNA